MVNIKNAIISATTIVEPTGVPYIIEINNPIQAHVTEITAAHIVTDKKLLQTRIADTAGKITSAVINKDPTKFIANTIITAVITAIIKLYLAVLPPIALEKFSSNVTANIL